MVTDVDQTIVKTHMVLTLTQIVVMLLLMEMKIFVLLKINVEQMKVLAGDDTCVEVVAWVDIRLSCVTHGTPPNSSSFATAELDIKSGKPTAYVKI